MNIQANFFPRKLNLRRHGRQHSEVKWMNPTSGQRRNSPDAWQKDPICQRPESHSSLWKLLLLIYKVGVY